MLLKIRQINRRLEIAGVVSKEGKPVKHATVHLSSRDHAYGAVTDSDGRFSIRPFPWASTPSLSKVGVKANCRCMAGTAVQ